jgi:hypothetical protein
MTKSRMTLRRNNDRPWQRRRSQLRPDFIVLLCALLFCRCHLTQAFVTESRFLKNSWKFHAEYPLSQTALLAKKGKLSWGSFVLRMEGMGLVS